MCFGGEAAGRENCMSRDTKKHYFFSYTMLFVFAVLVLFAPFYLTGHTLIWNMDAWSQHYRALIYYAEYLRSLVRGFFSGGPGGIPVYDFSFGEGNDLLGALHYYVIGDPFTFFSVFVPTRFLHVYYDIMMIVRLYVSGISFSCLCFQTGKKRGYAVLAGAFAYVFCYWGIHNVAKHPYFLNPMIFFPLLIAGVEKVLQKQKPYLLIVTVFFAAVSNFYFFYMMVILTVVYVAVRMIVSYRDRIREGMAAVCRIAVASVWGLLMASILFLPVCRIVLGDARISGGAGSHLFYPVSYYSRLPGLFLSIGSPEWLLMGYTAPVLLAVFLLFHRKKENGLLKGLFLAGMVMIAIPFLGRMLNGFSYASNRWCWAFALLCSYILTEMWPELTEIASEEWKFLVRSLAVYAVLCVFLERPGLKGPFAGIGLAAVFLVVTAPGKKGRIRPGNRQRILLMLVLAGGFYTGIMRFLPPGDFAVVSCKKSAGILENLTANESVAVSWSAAADGEEGFYRYSGPALTQNAGVTAGISSTQYFWTLSNSYVSEFRKMMELPDITTHDYNGYDDRTSLLTLADVLYYAKPIDSSVRPPYDFAQKADVEVSRKFERVYSVYRNSDALPLGYFYDGQISLEEWKTYPAVEKQEALLQAAVMEDYVGDIPEKDVRLTGREIDYKVFSSDKHVSVQDGAFIVTRPDSTVTLEFEGLPESETYVAVKGLAFEAVPVYDLYFGDERVDPSDIYNQKKWDKLSDAKKKSIQKKKKNWSRPDAFKMIFASSTGTSKTYRLFTEEHRYYNGSDDLYFNLNYAEEAAAAITITFPEIGIYSFDSLKVVCQPMEHYREEIAGLKERVLDDVDVGTNTVTGTVAPGRPGLLCLPIPYADGWSAYVDGEEARLYRVNVMYMGLELDEEGHSVRLAYRTPLLGAGAWLSAVSIGAFCLYVLIREVFGKRIDRKWILR